MSEARNRIIDEITRQEHELAAVLMKAHAAYTAILSLGRVGTSADFRKLADDREAMKLRVAVDEHLDLAKQADEHVRRIAELQGQLSAAK